MDEIELVSYVDDSGLMCEKKSLIGFLSAVIMDVLSTETLPVMWSNRKDDPILTFRNA